MTAARITVRRNDQNYGPYSLEQVNAMLIAGRVAGRDLAWLEGAPEWQPLSTVPGVALLPPPAEPARDADESEKLILPAFLFAFFFGMFGVHRFYAGRVGSGIAMLVLTLTVVGGVVTFFWYVVDTVVIACGGFRDAEEKTLRRWV